MDRWSEEQLKDLLGQQSIPPLMGPQADTLVCVYAPKGTGGQWIFLRKPGPAGIPKAKPAIILR